MPEAAPDTKSTVLAVMQAWPPDQLNGLKTLMGKAVESIGEGGAAGDIRGIASGIDLEGRLLVKRDDGTVIPVSSGEIRVRTSTR